MKKIRIGNDFVFAWEIERGGLPEDFSSVLEKHLHLSVFGKRVELIEGVDYDITGNVIRIEVTPTIANIIGTYKAEFHYILPDNGLIDEDRKCAVDVDAFQIVARTAQADDPSEFTVTSDMAIAFKGDKGDSAYQVWLDAGNTGTKEDYFAYLRQPAIDAGASISELESEIQSNEDLRVQAESERDLAETARIQAESERLAAETIRQSNEGDRIDNEATRVQNEAERISKENVRQSNEVDRVEAEGIRQSNEIDRIEAESERAQAEVERQITIQEAVTATNLANEKANLANIAAQNANEAAGLADTARTELTTAVNTKLEEADAKIEEMDTTLSAYDGRVSQVESDISQLESEVISNQFYGIEWDEAYATSACTRIGNQLLHATLPVHKKMRRCLLNDAGVVNYYLSETDSTKREDGRDAVLDGTDGQVMVELPAHYRKFETEGTKTRCLISEYPLSGYHFVPKAYRSAYQATVQRSASKLASVVNLDPDFRGGNNNSDWDGTYRSLLGKPASSISLTTFRTYARNRGAAGQGGAGWNCDLYELQKTTFWLYAIEYANFNVQLPFNAALTAQGYRQGGLGSGVTTLSSAAWSAYNSYNPFIPCGYTNSLGNKSGIVPFTMPAEYGTALTVDVPSYRGIENPFGHIWHWTDGLRVRYTTAEEGNLGELYVQLDPTKYNSEIMADYTKRGLLPPSSGYIKSMITGEFGENMPATVGGASTTYFADNHYQPTRPPETELIRGVCFGGFAAAGASAGLACSSTSVPVSYTAADVGSRLCFLP